MVVLLMRNLNFHEILILYRHGNLSLGFWVLGSRWRLSFTRRLLTVCGSIALEGNASAGCRVSPGRLCRLGSINSTGVGLGLGGW